MTDFLFTLPGHVQHLPKLPGRPALYVFFPDGRLDIVECGLEYNFEAKRLRAILNAAVVQDGTWKKTGPSVAVTLPCSHLPAPVGTPPCKGSQTFDLHKFQSADYVDARD